VEQPLTDPGAPVGTEPNEVPTGRLVLIGLFAALGVFVIILGLLVLFYRAEARLEQERHFGVPYTEVENLVAEQQATLVEYRWLDQEKNIVAIPIDRAMEIVVRELQAQQAREPKTSE